MRPLMGRWYELKVVGNQIEDSYRFELFFAADGTCTYSSIPTIPGSPLGVRRGTWRIDGQSVVFTWGRDSRGAASKVESGLVEKLDKHKLVIGYTNVFQIHNFQMFYRSYRESVAYPGEKREGSELTIDTERAEPGQARALSARFVPEEVRWLGVSFNIALFCSEPGGVHRARQGARSERAYEAEAQLRLALLCAAFPASQWIDPPSPGGRSQGEGSGENGTKLRAI